MCLAVPSKVIRIDGLAATVEAYGQQRIVNLMLIEDEVAVGDYVLVQAGGLAFERLDAERARESLAMIEQVVTLGASDIRAW